mmetsp:Transcript_10075/g.18882  ORF Transcript_10075/g.18882 Transcript_10075/m.18882 type:complete len:208 (+) Transcript_10075:194-817(+)
MISPKIKQFFLFIGNSTIAVAWICVIWTYLKKRVTDEHTCSNFLRPKTVLALLVSGIEILNSILGLTKSKPHQVILFSVTRAAVELLLAPLIPCNAPEHLWTVGCWALDGPFRFGCFGIDSFMTLCGFEARPIIKSIRYTVSPLIFPLGAGGEMFMVLRAARDGRPGLYFAASLWPIFFYPLMMQLLNQRKKHFERLKAAKMEKKSN